MKEKAVFRYLELPIFESSNLMQPFFIAPVYSTSIPARINFLECIKFFFFFGPTILKNIVTAAI